jgi:MFS family permease
MCFSLGNTGLMMTTLSENVPRERMAFAFGILNAGGPIGGFVGPIVGGPIVDARGLPTLLLADSAVLAVVIAALWFGYRDRYEGRGAADGRSVVRMALESVKDLWNSKVFPLIPALFLLFTGWMLANTYVPLSVMSIYHGVKEGTAIGLVMGGGGLATLIIAPLMGGLADKLGMWKVMGAAAVLQVALWMVPQLCPDIVTFAVAWAVVNGVASGVFSIAFTLLSESAPIESRGRVMAFAYLPVNAGALVGAGVGMAVGATTSVFAMFAATAVFTAGGVAGLWVARRRVS